MENIKKINDELTIVTEQITAEQLYQAALEGYKSVMNLKASEEESFIKEEPLQVRAAGLQYINVPIKPGTLTKELTDVVLKHIEELPKPALIHSESGIRSEAMVLMSLANRQHLTVEQTLQKAHELGFDCDNNPEIKEFIIQYIESK